MDKQLNIEILPATVDNLIELLHDLEGLSDEEKERFGFDSEEILLKVFNRSLFIDAAFVNGKIVGIWGIIGDYMGYNGRPWSLLSPAAEKYPFRLTTHYRKVINKMAQLFPVLIDMVDIRHTKVLRMLKLMGFTFEEPRPFRNGLFIKAIRRT